MLVSAFGSTAVTSGGDEAATDAGLACEPVSSDAADPLGDSFGRDPVSPLAEPFAGRECAPA